MISETRSFLPSGWPWSNGITGWKGNFSCLKSVLITRIFNTSTLPNNYSHPKHTGPYFLPDFTSHSHTYQVPRTPKHISHISPRIYLYPGSPKENIEECILPQSRFVGAFSWEFDHEFDISSEQRICLLLSSQQKSMCQPISETNSSCRHTPNQLQNTQVPTELLKSKFWWPHILPT